MRDDRLLVQSQHDWVESRTEQDSGQHTLGHLNCPECARACQEAMHSGQFGTYLFPQAASIWLAIKARAVSPGMVRDYTDCIKALTRFFAFMPLDKIHIGHVQVYQRSRNLRVGASRINKEIVTLGQILGAANLWKPIKQYYKPLPIPLSIGVALEEEEENYLFQLAEQRREGRWLVCYCASLIENGTGAGPGEIRHLQIRDVSLKDNVIWVRRALKNRYRQRALPLNEDARWAVERLLRRYRETMKKYGIAESLDHYLLFHRSHRGDRPGRKPNRGGAPGIDKAQKLSWESRTCPHCSGRFLSLPRLERHIALDHPEQPLPERLERQIKSRPDPTKPQGDWYSAWHALRKELAKRYPHLAKLRRYDLRHNACTKMLEQGIPEKVVEEVMGHKINSQIKDRYSHIRLQAKRKAAEVLQGNHTRPAPPPAPTLPEKTEPAPTSHFAAPSARPASSFALLTRGKVVAMPVRRPWR